ncbi:hypothetical protein BLD25_03430 [Candidatus Gracilibacteria bacterium GN02-872]|nr:hypothetical protein BLD25_03430 [Candidatus Gracilibacteria bacterium GN02-872]
MIDVPSNFYRYKQLPIYTKETIPKGLLLAHNTKAGVYGKINVLSGKLKYNYLESENGGVKKEVFVEAGDYIVSAPQAWHKVEFIGDTKIYIEFFAEKPEEIRKIEKDFFTTFPNMGPHYEVKMLVNIIENPVGKKALDLGSGGGRNSLLLAKNGLKVESWDKNLEGLENTKDLADKFGLNLEIKQKDLNYDLVEDNFDIIIATVSLQFLEKQSATNLLKSAINHTNIGGYNLIIVPIEADDIKCIIPFPNMRTYQEYLDLYKNWEIVYSDNMIGQFHRVDENGHRIRARFATIIAKKV